MPTLLLVLLDKKQVLTHMERAEKAKVSLLRYLGCVPFSQTFFGYRQSGWLDYHGRKNKNLEQV